MLTGQSDFFLGSDFVFNFNLTRPLTSQFQGEGVKLGVASIFSSYMTTQVNINAQLCNFDRINVVWDAYIHGSSKKYT